VDLVIVVDMHDVLPGGQVLAHPGPIVCKNEKDGSCDESDTGRFRFRTAFKAPQRGVNERFLFFVLRNSLTNHEII
jgi:hypothetical protein